MDVDVSVMEAASGGRVAWVLEDDHLPAHAGCRLEVTFPWRDASGRDVVGRGRVWLPEALEGRAPLLHHAGYEMLAEATTRWLAEGFVVSTTLMPEAGSVWPGVNPISRGMGLDVAFLHVVRSAPFVDDANVAIAGGSAGGYMTLMLAAETFPLAVAMPEVPVVNLGYNTAFWRANHGIASRPLEAGAPAMPYLAMLEGLADETVALYGADTDADVYRTHSPVGHLERITCPVVVTFSTADDLVPIDQVGSALAAPLVADVPSGLELRAERLCADGPGRLRLLDELDPAMVDVSVHPVPEGTERRDLTDPTAPARAHVIPIDASDRRWTVAIVDEGPPDEDVPHYRYNVAPDPAAVWRRHLGAPVTIDQLDGPKLSLLIDRWSGVEWLAGGPPMLDLPEAERADVARSLRTWCALSPAHAERLRTLYAALPPARQVLPADLLGG